MGTDQCAHLRQGCNHPRHGASQKGLIAGEHAVKRLTGQQAHHQPDTGARIADIHDLLRGLEPAQTDPVDRELTCIGVRDLHAHVPKRGQSCQGVLTLEKSTDCRPAFRNGAQHNRPM